MRYGPRVVTNRTRISFLPVAALVCAALWGGLWVTNASAQNADGVATYDRCDTPQAATLTFLGNLQEGEEQPDLAVRCFDWGDTPVGDHETLARKLKAALDQRGLYIDVDALPDDPNAEGRVELSRRLPAIYLNKVDGRWLISRESVGQIAALYDDTFSVDVEEFVHGLPQWMRAPLLPGLSTWQLLGLLLSIVLGLVVRWLTSTLVVGQGTRLLAKAGGQFDQSVMRRAGQPIGTLALAGVLWWMLPLLRFSVRINQIGHIAIRVMAAAAVVMLAYRLVDLGADVFARRAEKTETKLDDQLVPLIRRALKVFVVAIGIIFVMQNLDVDVGSLLAGASLGGLAFTLAAKDTVANLFGSISIFADQPFQVGDWVVIDGKEGVVEEVGMRSTRIRTFYDSVVSIPNSTVANAAVDNYGQRRHRRCMVTLGITYDATPAQVKAFVQGVRGILAANGHVRPGYEVHFRNFGDSALEVLVYFFLETGTWTEELTERQSIFLEVMWLAKALGVDFAFPTQTLHVQSFPKPSEVSSAPHPAAEKEAELMAIAARFGPETVTDNRRGPADDAGASSRADDADAGDGGGDGG